MTTLSIPERAREIAEQTVFDVDGCCAYDVDTKGGYREIHEPDCPFLKALAEAMRSERELCAKELEEIAEDVVRGGTTLSNMEMAVLAGSIGHLTKVLRDGGK